MTQHLIALLDDLKKIAELKSVNFDISKYQLVNVKHQQQIFDNSKAVVDFIEQQGAVNGWVQETSHIHHLHEESYKWRSIPLNAEWVDSSNNTFILDYFEKGKWQINQFKVSQASPDQANYLAEKMIHCEVDSGKQLNYLRLWHFEDNKPVADIAIFVGFEEK